MRNRRKSLRCVLLFSLFVFGVGLCNAQTLFEKGENAFNNNKPVEARMLLENSLAENPANQKTYLYLGIIYEQLGENALAVNIAKKGIDAGDLYLDRFHLNLANNLFLLEQYEEAEMMYSRSIQINSTLSSAYLNRANTRVTLGKLSDALDDYKFYLYLNPNNPQRTQIEQVMAMINTHLEQERQRLAAEEAERKREEERQQALYDAIMNSLQNASEDTENLSVEAEGITDYEDEEEELED